MSTRVHELAKELNVKNQEILDFLKAEGENVKESHLASLEPHQIEKVRQRYVSDRPASSPPPPVPPAQNSPVVVERTEPPKPTTEDRNLTTVAEPKAREEFPVTAPKDKRETPAVVPPRTFATPSEPAKAHQPPVADQAVRPSAQTPSFVTPPAPSAPAQGAAPVRTMPPLPLRVSQERPPQGVARS